MSLKNPSLKVLIDYNFHRQKYDLKKISPEKKINKNTY